MKLFNVIKCINLLFAMDIESRLITLFCRQILCEFNCRVSFFTFKSLINLEFILLYDRKYGPNFIIFQMIFQFSQHYLKKKNWSSDIRCHFYHILNFHMYLSSLLYFLLNPSGLIMFHNYTSTLIAEALQCILISGGD